uniref:Uncharacterized protein n=1 Tax=mine drainage metagenome TaxID=410659 RepID=E6PF15_9ZZZZ
MASGLPALLSTLFNAFTGEPTAFAEAMESSDCTCALCGAEPPLPPDEAPGSVDPVPAAPPPQPASKSAASVANKT